jgi:hypothetical protein
MGWATFANGFLSGLNEFGPFDPVFAEQFKDQHSSGQFEIFETCDTLAAGAESPQ